AILMCSGESGIRVVPESEDELRVGEALDALLRQLAILIVADGEGAGRIARVVARGGSAQLVERAARAVANSPLVKAALHGGDPNWGRIAQAVGGALPGDELLALEISIEGIRVCSAGAAVGAPARGEESGRDVVLLKYVGLNPIVVHGGGPEISAYMERLGLPVEFVGGLRVSSEGTVEVAKMVLVGKVNKEIVLRLNRHGQPAVGLSGDDGLLFRVARRPAPGGEVIGFVGRIERVNVGVIEHVGRDYIPVIASVGADREGRSY